MHEMLIRKVVKVNRNVEDLRDILLKVLKIGGEQVVESEFLTVKEFAERAGVSVQSVYQRLNKSLKPYFKVIKGVKYIEIKALTEVYGLKVEQGFKGDFKENVKGFKQDFKGSEERKNNTSEREIEKLKEQLRQKDEEMIEQLRKKEEYWLGQLEKKNEEMAERLNQKDEQLRRKDEEIAERKADKEQLYQLLDQEQKLRAIEQQKYLEVKTELEERQNRKWWQFWK